MRHYSKPDLNQCPATPPATPKTCLLPRARFFVSHPSPHHQRDIGSPTETSTHHAALEKSTTVPFGFGSVALIGLLHSRRVLELPSPRARCCLGSTTDVCDLLQVGRSVHTKIMTRYLCLQTSSVRQQRSYHTRTRSCHSSALLARTVLGRSLDLREPLH